MDTESWWNSSLRHDIASYSGDDLFFAIVGNSPLYTQYRSRLRRWSRRELQFVIPERTINSQDAEMTSNDERVYLGNNFIRLPSRSQSSNDLNIEEVTFEPSLEFFNISTDWEPTENSTNISNDAQNTPLVQPADIQAGTLVQNKYSLESLLPNFESIIQKIFKTYQFSKFTGHGSRHSLYNSLYRPSSEDWSNFLLSMVEKKILADYGSEKTTLYQFNLETPSGSFVRVEYVLESIHRRINRTLARGVSSTELRKGIRYCYRPKIDQWKRFLDYLVEEEVLASSLANGIEYYSLRQ